jgi:hypothetical protein
MRGLETERTVLNLTIRRTLGIAGALWILAGYQPGSLSAQDSKDSPIPGDVVRVGRLGVFVPPPGVTVVAYGDFVDGTGEQLVVETLLDGTVLINPPDPMASPSPAVQTVAPLATGECDDNYTDVSSKPWADTMQWWFHSSTTPPSLIVSEVVTDLRAGTQNITHEVNSCGRPDTVSATSNYNGSNTLPVNITNAGVCASHGDDTSEVGFGTLPSSFIAATCNWANLFFRIESDIRFNKNSIYTFTTGSCSGQFSSSYYVEGIMTHERGHTWNVRDFPSGHPNMTMGGANAQCPDPDQKRTLGLGDMLSLESVY